MRPGLYAPSRDAPQKMESWWMYVIRDLGPHPYGDGWIYVDCIISDDTEPCRVAKRSCNSNFWTRVDL